MKKITQDQKDLLAVVAQLSGSNTKQIREYLAARDGERWWRQAYESHLRNRLFRLQPLLKFEEITRGSHVVSRRWFITETGLDALK